MKIRASRLPLAMVCPASMQATDYVLDSDGDAARLGSAVHEWLGKRIATQAIEGDEAFDLLAVKYTLPVDDIRALSIRAWKLWREVEQWFPSPVVEGVVEKDLGQLQMTGHVDVMSYNAESRIVFVNDHKTGFLDSDHSDQVRAYGLMALDRFPDADQVHTCIMRVRDYTTDHANYSKAELVAWSQRVVQRVVEEQESYQPGRHCSFCPRRMTCKAFADWVRWAFELLSSGEIIDMSGSASPELVRKVYDAKSALSRLLEEAGEVLKTLAMARGGVLEKDDGMQLQMISQIRRVIMFKEAWPLLSKRVEEDFWNQVFAVGKTELIKIIRLGAGRGEKERAVAELMQSLEDAGAIAEETINRLENRKKSQEAIAA